MTIEQLKGMGLTDEQAGKVMEALDGNFVPKARFNEVNTELASTKSAVKERDKQLADLKGSTGDMEGLRQTITALQADNKAKDEAHAKEVRQIRTDNAIEKALTQAKAKNLTAAKALLAGLLKKAEVGEDGSVKGLDEEIKKLTESADTGFLFDATPAGNQIAGATPASGTGTPPNPKAMGYETRLAEARKNGDTLAAIQVKQQAAAEGIILM